MWSLKGSYELWLSWGKNELNWIITVTRSCERYLLVCRCFFGLVQAGKEVCFEFEFNLVKFAWELGLVLESAAGQGYFCIEVEDLVYLEFLIKFGSIIPESGWPCHATALELKWKGKKKDWLGHFKKINFFSSPSHEKYDEGDIVMFSIKICKKNNLKHDFGDVRGDEKQVYYLEWPY